MQFTHKFKYLASLLDIHLFNLCLKLKLFFLRVQVRMAEIFVNIFGDKLVKENLVELNNLDRLPSPHQLQRKIILKGTEPSAVTVVKSIRTLPCKIYK